MNNDIKQEFRNDFFVLGQLMTNLRYSNPNTINRVRKQNDKSELSQEDYNNQLNKYNKLLKEYNEFQNNMKNKYGDIDEAVKKYGI